MTSRGADLVVERLSKSYGGQAALRPTDLAIKAGEFFSLIGPSGSGKSTLLGCIAGFVTPTAGRIAIAGADVVDVPPYRRNIGMVFQNYALFPHLSVFENVAFPLRLRKIGSAEIQDRVKRMLETVRLAEYGDRSPAQLSGGQQQRVALARSAVYDPQLLLMDEPLGALDKNLREEMQYEIRRFHANMGATIVYVTHDQDEAATMSHRIGIMRDGALVQTGAPRELYENPANAFVAGFLGEANLYDVRDLRPGPGGALKVVTVDGLELEAEAGKAVPAGSLVACVRPEAVSLAGTDAGPVIAGTVEDIIFTAGTVRCRIATPQGARVLMRRPLERHRQAVAVGDAVKLSYRPADILLIAKE
ncbi:MAG: ABC transporter ATP-binding protein [Rhodospirillales bacterium]|nr:ABC transporter ATP-binding protein [Rhodospirillales bacterium]